MWIDRGCPAVHSNADIGFVAVTVVLRVIYDIRGCDIWRDLLDVNKKIAASWRGIVRLVMPGAINSSHLLYDD